MGISLDWLLRIKGSRGRLLGKLYVISVPIWNTEVGLNRGEISRLVDGRIQSISYDMSLRLGVLG